MSTFLFDKIVFGPVYSRRLGVSLGINLLPHTHKLCTFDCIYCECGPNNILETKPDNLPSREQVKLVLYQTLEELAANDNDPDVITFAGNGEPTLHPDFPGIIEDTIEVRDIFFPYADIAVLTNSTTVGKPEIRDALSKIEKPILKLDSAFSETIKLHNRPASDINAKDLISNLAALDFEITIQSMFIEGFIDNTLIDNTSEKEIAAWIQALMFIKPSEVQVYTVSRDTPAGADIKKVSVDKLNSIAEKVQAIGIKTQVSA